MSKKRKFIIKEFEKFPLEDFTEDEFLHNLFLTRLKEAWIEVKIINHYNDIEKLSNHSNAENCKEYGKLASPGFYFLKKLFLILQSRKHPSDSLLAKYAKTLNDLKEIWKKYSNYEQVEDE